MATKIVTKNSSTGGSAPSASDLVQGELAVNVTDKRLYTENNAGAIVELGTNPASAVTMASTLAVTGNVGIGTSSLTGGNTILNLSRTGSGVGCNMQFANSHNGAFYVGLAGNTSGDAILHSADGTAGMAFGTGNTERFRIAADGAATFTPAAGGHAVFNENGLDVDFAVESDANSAMLFVDGGENRVGVGTSTPGYTLDVQAGAAATLNIGRSSAYDDFGRIGFNNSRSYIQSEVIDGTANGDTYLAFFTQSGGTVAERLKIELLGGLTTTPVAGGHAVFNEGSVDADFRVESTNDANALFVRGSDGYIGMGAGASPVQPLTIGTSVGSGLNYWVGTTNVISGGSGIKVSRSTTNDATVGMGLNLSNTESTDTAMSPMIAFSAKSASNTYSVAYAGIWGRKISSGTDTNWNVGDIEFGNANSAGLRKRMSLNWQGALRTFPDTAGHAVFNEDSADADFRVESTNDANALFLNGATGNVLFGGTADRGGKICVGGTTSTARILPQTDNVGYIGQSDFRWQALYAINGTVQTSDEREKTEIKPTTLGLDFIKDLRPVSYKWIDGEQQDKGKDEREHQGLIAQQVAEAVEKHGIDKNAFGGLDIKKTAKYDDFHGMAYDQLVAPLIKAIQEQQTLIESLTARIAALEE